MSRYNKIMIGSNREKKEALEAGWSEDQIIRPTVQHLEGLRWKTILITWLAFDILRHADGVWERLHKDGVAQNGVVAITDIKAPPGRSEW